MEGVLRWKLIINHLVMTQSNSPYRFLRSLDCPFKHLTVKGSPAFRERLKEQSAGFQECLSASSLNKDQDDVVKGEMINIEAE